MLRRIIHIDMDAFYASVEQRDNPSLRGQPVAVGSSRERGVVLAASYEARRFGVHSAMASVTARRKCPELIFVPPRFDAYRAISDQIRGIFARYTAVLQPLLLDEAYLDVTAQVPRLGTATSIAMEIKRAILEETGLTASAGVSYNKSLAKLASDYRKPDGLFVITPNMGPAFVESLPITKFHGIGPVTAARMNALGILTGRDLRNKSRAFLLEHFGKAADFYYAIARGEDDRPVNPDRAPKSIGAERTFEQDLQSWTDVEQALGPIVDKLWGHYESSELPGRTVVVKVKYADFQVTTRRRSLADAVTSRRAVEQIAFGLLRPLFPLRRGVRLLGVSIGNMHPTDGAQLRLTLDQDLRLSPDLD